MKPLASYLAGTWHLGTGEPALLLNPATEVPLASIAPRGLDAAASFAEARQHGRPGLAGLTFAERGALLATAAKAIHGAREELLELAVISGGNTRGDAKFDIDGACGTLSHYAELGATLGSGRVMYDGEPIQVGRTARLSGQHAWFTGAGVALHINAFNFPAWGLCEKLACALLAGMPVIAKPATATAAVAQRLCELVIPLLPRGVLQLFLGSPGPLLDPLRVGDVIAFTGSSATAAHLRTHPNVIKHAVRLGIEADSVNAAVIGVVSPGSETFGLAVTDVVRDLTQKAGQKCTAIRRVLVPDACFDDFAEAVRERVKAVVVGDPTIDGVRMGPLATRAQRDEVTARLGELRAATTSLYDEPVAPLGVNAGTGFFVGPVVRLSTPENPALVANEIFGPVVTLCRGDSSPAHAAAFVAQGDGSLCASVFSDDREYLTAFVAAAAPWTGRIYMGSEKIAAMSIGPGAVLPQLTHGGPGRAGGGEELGGVRGLHHYMQRTALQGDLSLLRGL